MDGVNRASIPADKLQHGFGAFPTRPDSAQESSPSTSLGPVRIQDLLRGV